MRDFLYETVEAINDNRVTRLKSSLFYWGGLLSIIGGAYLLSEKMMFGGFLILTLAPCLFLYPLVRFFFGGKDSLGGIVATVVVEEALKSKINNVGKKKKKRH